MNYIKEYTVDIVVVGAGTAGCSAAIAAGMRKTARVLLLERYGFLGGTSTQSLDTFYGFFTPGDTPRKAAGGVPDMVVDRLDAHNEIFLRPNTYGAGTGVTYNPEYLKVVWDRLTLENGVDVLLHTRVVDVAATKDGGFELTALTTRGYIRIRALRLIDTSGDATAAASLGVELEEAGSLEAAQTFTTTFRMCNVDLDAYRKAGGKRLLQEKMAEAVEGGTYPLPRKTGSVHAMSLPNCIATVAVRVPFTVGLDPGELSRAEREGRGQVYVYEEFLRAQIPGFADAKVIGMSSPQIGIRESRRMFGAYRLERNDCLSEARFDDAVMVCGAPIEDHRQSEGSAEETEWVYVPNGGVYQVPYRCFLPKDQENIWVAGRCFSASHSAQASCRSMAQTMSMGQATGLAAALSIEGDCSAHGVPVGALQDELRKIGAVIEEPTKMAFVGAHDWQLNRQG
jgi:hypothetical protein